ncbi:MAG TPA: pyridoxamine 5'-phosphate oxidase family protein, partial [Bacteroidia bacterium]|nr:pyridoxamine 5'-phosphate oxidase family protein [Bacteroidia bacterium]
ITFMFCSFDKVPNILRLYGSGQTILPSHKTYKDYSQYFEMPIGVRQFIYSKIHRVQTSCGYGVPLFDFVADRNTLNQWAVNKGNTLHQYQQEKNLISIDGLPTALNLNHGK